MGDLIGKNWVSYLILVRRPCRSFECNIFLHLQVLSHPVKSSRVLMYQAPQDVLMRSSHLVRWNVGLALEHSHFNLEKMWGSFLRIGFMCVVKGANPAGIYLLKVKNRNTRARCEICSELTVKTPKVRTPTVKTPLVSFWCLYC